MTDEELEILKAKAAAFDEIFKVLHGCNPYDLPDSVFLIREKYTAWDICE